VKYSTPITNESQAMSFLKQLAAEEKLFHPDDPAATIYCSYSNTPVFTPEEATLIDQRMAEVFDYLADPYETVLDLAGA
jgi:hypothetical protein